METKQIHSPSKGEDRLVRIMSTDIEGNKKVYVGLTKIKGISWSFANAVCKVLKIDKTKKVGELTKEDIQNIINFVKNPKVPGYLQNRQFDLDSGENKHLTGSDLDLRKDFDIKRLKQMKSYRGLRHGVGLPLRGQRTKGNFRRNRKKSVGIKKKTKKQ